MRLRDDASRAATCRMSSASTTRRCWRRYSGGGFSSSTAARCRTAALPRSPGQPYGHRAPPCDLPAESGGAGCGSGPARRACCGIIRRRVQNPHPERRFRQQRNRLPSHRTGKATCGWRPPTVFRSSSLRNGTDHHLPCVPTRCRPSSSIPGASVRHPACSTSAETWARAFQARSASAQDLGTPRAAGARELKVNSVAQHPSDDGILTQQLDDTERIVLDHKQRNIDISYEAVAFLSPEKIRFAYRLSGGHIDDNEWNYVEKPQHGQLFPPAGGPLRLRTEGAESRRILEQEPRRLEIVVRPRRCSRGTPFCSALVIVGGTAALRQQALPAPAGCKKPSWRPPESSKGGGAHQHEDQLLHEHLPRTADAP